MTWIIGDIHGCYSSLKRLVTILPSEDPLIFLGDYVDRGPHSAQVIRYLLTLRHRSIFLMGNHEEMLLTHFRNAESPMGLSWLEGGNGGKATLDSYNLKPEDPFSALPSEHREFFENLLPFYEGEDFIAVHAGVDVDGTLDIRHQERDTLLWTRSQWIGREAEWGGKFVYYGHTPTIPFPGVDVDVSPRRGIRSMGLDGGCVYGGVLFAWNHEERALLQVRCENQ